VIHSCRSALVSDKSAVMVAVLGASATVASLLLVVQGYFLSSLYGSPPEQMTDTVKGRYKKAILAASLALGLSIVVSLLAVLWLLGVDLFWLTVGGFLASLVSVLALSVVVTRQAWRV
jgi:hypothetical protein